MCLGVPGRIVAIDGLVATVDFWGMRRDVRLELVDQPVAVGDYVLNHVGYAIRRIPEADIEGTLELYEQLLREAGASDEDLMTADVRNELAAAPASADAAEEPAVRGRRARRSHGR
jgi:hydrogenase expression/formation protein HypC